MALNGIIISTQSPVKTGSFPRPGGTAFGLNKVTGLPVIKMHRDGKARSTELDTFKQINNHGLIFITGHGSELANEFSGMYVNSGEYVKSYFQWSIEAYVNLLMNNLDIDKLKKQAGSALPDTDKPARPHLNIVLWVCRGARGDEDSAAAKMARLFAKKGIDVSILANQHNTNRFNGDMTGGKLSFHSNPADLKLFHCNNDQLTIEKIKSLTPVYVHHEGVDCFYPYVAKECVPVNPIFDIHKIAIQAKQYSVISLDNKAQIKPLFRSSPSSIIMATSSVQAYNNNPECYYFTISICDIEKGVINHRRHKITKNGEINQVSVRDNRDYETRYDNIDEAITRCIEGFIPKTVAIKGGERPTPESSKENQNDTHASDHDFKVKPGLCQNGDNEMVGTQPKKPLMQNKSTIQSCERGFHNKGEIPVDKTGPVHLLPIDFPDDKPTARPEKTGTIETSFLLSLYHHEAAKPIGILVTAMLLGAAAGLVAFTALAVFTTPAVATVAGVGVGIGVAAVSGACLGFFASSSHHEVEGPVAKNTGMGEPH